VIDHDRFQKGPFTLGKWGIPVGAVACTWILLITIFFNLPSLNPVSSQTFNYTCVAVGIVLVYSLGMWFLYARKWFSGPIKTIEAEARGIDVMDPAAFTAAEKGGALDKE